MTSLLEDIVDTVKKAVDLSMTSLNHPPLPPDMNPMRKGEEKQAQEKMLTVHMDPKESQARMHQKKRTN